MMLAFDTPIPFSAMGRRNVSNVPAQALILMNDPFVAEQAKVWATRVLEDKSQSAEQRIGRMYLQAFSRPASPGESGDALEFLRLQSANYGLQAEQGLTDVRVWSDLGHVLLNVKEFTFLN
jgi:hypothetical protein